MNKIYIGSAVWFDHRWRIHKSELNRNIHKNRYLQRAWNKYGHEAFEFEILERCNKENLIAIEQFWIDWTNSKNPQIGFNLSPIAGSQLGYKHTENFKKEQSARYKGIKQSPELIAKRATANTGNKRSKETRAKMSAWQKGKKLPEWHRELLSNAHKKDASELKLGKQIEI